MTVLRRLTARFGTAIGVPFHRKVLGFIAHLACALVLAGFFASASALAADNARFDLTGPRIDVRVTRAGVTLPIASVPNLQSGDRIWLHPDLPATQSVRYLMVLAFLRGTTNPPPDNWFIRIETWDKKVRAEGVEVKVPDEAQQAVLFLAPVTGGDFTTLRSAVQGRPGVFVRASQDLTAAGFEEARIEKYIASMRQLSPEEAADAKQLQQHSNVIAATLALKPNGDCVKLAPDQQYTCLTQSGSQSLLDDGHGESIIASLTGGATAGLIGTASYTQLAGAGVYSAYVGTIVDLVHIMGSLHTAQYQYIPAIASPEREALNLRLNVAPSFHNPKSVIVIGLPSVQKSVPPPLRAADPKQVACLANPKVVLPVEGAPLVFSTGFAHDLVLHLNRPARAESGQPQDIPLTADAFRGGLVLAPGEKRRVLRDDVPGGGHASGSHEKSISATRLSAAASGADHAEKASGPARLVSDTALTGTIQGYWGFDPFTGPTMPLQDEPGKDWHVAGDNTSGHWLIAGRDRKIELASTGTACVESIALEPANGKRETATWKPADKPDTIDVSVDVPSHDAGTIHLAIHQFGAAKPDAIALTAYSEPAKLDALSYHAGDNAVTLTGTSLDQVRQVSFEGASFDPAGKESISAQPNGKSELRLTLPPNNPPPALHPGKETAEVALDDGRTLKLPFTIETARPAVTLLGRAAIAPASAAKSPFQIHLGSPSDLSVGDALTFSLHSAQIFPRDGSIEIASPDGSLHTKLSVAANSMVLEDPHTVLATFEPLKTFGPSAFGPIQLRAVAADGTAGDWLPLVTLVRLPSFTSLSCAASSAGTPASAAPEHGGTTRSTATNAATTTDTTGSGKSGASKTAIAPPPSEAIPDSAAIPPTPAASCTLTGTGLYLIDSVAAAEAFTSPTHVPEGYVGATIDVPAPTGAVYYLRLRDDPATIDTVTLPSGPLDKPITQ
jgi:hypothetical protein